MFRGHDDTVAAAPGFSHGTSASRRKSAWRRIFPSREGAAAIEFALLAIPYFLIVFAIIETFIAYTGEQLVANAVDSMARKLKTGNITYKLGRTTDKTEPEFRRIFCDEVSILIKCSEAEIAKADKLDLDVRTFTTFATIPTTVPLAADKGLDKSAFGYSPGGPKTINMVRAYYQWQIITDLIRPYISNIKPTSGSGSYFLIVETAAFQNEDYP